jgi:hypothetical protein
VCSDRVHVFSAIHRSGTEWMVFDVVPRGDDRRAADRRQADQGRQSSPEDRRTDDRRAGFRSSRPVRLTRGWLCFERDGERRRLQPIPEDWHHLPESDLIALLREARVAPRRSPGAQESQQNQSAGISRR